MEYIDENGVKHPHIYLFEKEQNGFVAGWYYGDANDQAVGPHGTLDECEDALQRYGAMLAYVQ